MSEGSKEPKKDIFKKLKIKHTSEKKEVKPIKASTLKAQKNDLPSGHFYLVATCMQHLEPELEKELLALGVTEYKVQKRAIRFLADLEMMYKANIWLRTAIKIIKPIYHFTAEGPDDLYQKGLEIEWEKIMDSSNSFSIDFSVNSEHYSHSQFAALRLKDAIVDRFRKLGKNRPNVERHQPDLRFHLHIKDKQVDISIDSSGDPLFKRGYRREQHFAPINECLAAGMILKTGWKGEEDFFDPMAGSATIAIEAAMIACNIPVNAQRVKFGFESWADYDQALLAKVLRDAQKEYKELKCKIYARELQSNNIRAARNNINAANMRKSIILEQADFFKENPPFNKGIMVMNPPYGERLELKEGMPDFFTKIGSTLKHEYSGWTAWIISSDIESFHNIALKPDIKIPLLNGKLDCQFRKYTLFEGKLAEKKARE